MARTATWRALGLAVLMVAMTFAVAAQSVSAGEEPREQPMLVGPRIDELVWSEEGDRSKALTEIIAGNRDTIMFDIRSAADKERAEASDQVDTFPAFGLFDEFSMNPVERNQTANFPRNPFAIRAVREGMNWLIDRDFVVRDIYGGFAIPYKTPWHPRSPDYGRGIADFLKLEDKYAFDPERGASQIRNALTAAGWTLAADAGCGPAPNPTTCWKDPENRVVTIKGLKRTQDERLQLGGYYEGILRGLGFRVEPVPVVNAAIPYGTPPAENQWSYYTAGWISTALTAWDDGQLFFFATCGIGEPYCSDDPADGVYTPPAELLDIATKLQFANYADLPERASLIARGTELTMNESIRIFIDARQSTFVNNARMDGMVWDLFGGNTNQFALKAADVPGNATGYKRAQIMNLLMFVDGWNPWVYPGWLYDSVQRRALTDPPMSPHPHTGRYIDYRTASTVTTAGPAGTLAVPSDAIVFNTATNAWNTVAAGTTATSKVSYDMHFGNWHHAVPITMQDILYEWSSLWRRAQGDIDAVPGINNAATPAAKVFVSDTLKAIKPVDSDTLEVYLDYYHVDPQEIAAFGASFPSAPWEVQELGTNLVLNQIAATHDADAGTTGRLWLDLTKGDSLLSLAPALTNMTTANWVPPGMGTVPGGVGQISSANASARWAALNTWYGTFGHFWPSNGPWYLDTVDTTNRQTIMKAHRNGYPFQETKWDALRTVAIPSVNFAPTPPVVFAKTPAVFDFTVTVGPLPTDDFVSTWFLRDSSTGEFLITSVPTRLGTGSYRIEISGAKTEELLLGNFEVISVVTGNAAAVPSINRVGFLILPSTEWFQALLDARAGLIEGDVTNLNSNLGTIQSDLSSLRTSTDSLTGLVSAMAILAVVAIVIALVSVMLVLRKGRAPPTSMAEPSPPRAEEEEPPGGEST